MPKIRCEKLSERLLVHLLRRVRQRNISYEQISQILERLC
jgi:hypothetical protein